MGNGEWRVENWEENVCMGGLFVHWGKKNRKKGKEKEWKGKKKKKKKEKTIRDPDWDIRSSFRHTYVPYLGTLGISNMSTDSSKTIGYRYCTLLYKTTPPSLSLLSSTARLRR